MHGNNYDIYITTTTTTTITLTTCTRKDSSAIRVYQKYFRFYIPFTPNFISCTYLNTLGGACGVMVMIVENKISYPRTKPERGCSHFK